MGDKITELPVDTIPPTTEEKEMCGWLFHPTDTLKKSVSSLWNEFQNYLYLGLLFAVLSLSPVDSLLKGILPMASSFIVLLVIKTFLFLSLYWLFVNSRFSR